MVLCGFINRHIFKKNSSRAENSLIPGSGIEARWGKYNFFELFSFSFCISQFFVANLYCLFVFPKFVSPFCIHFLFSHFVAPKFVCSPLITKMCIFLLFNFLYSANFLILFSLVVILEVIFIFLFFSVEQDDYKGRKSNQQIKPSFIVGLAEGMPYISLHRIIYPDPARQIYIKRKNLLQNPIRFLLSTRLPQYINILMSNSSLKIPQSCTVMR